MSQSEQIRLFPLERILYPYMILPLHIYEDRYKEMVKLCLEEDSSFGLIHIDSLELHGIGTKAKIIHVTKEYDDGQIDIIVKGMDRFRIKDVDDKLPYLRGSVEVINDVSALTDISRLDLLVELYYKFLEALSLDSDQRSILENLTGDPDREVEISYMIAQTIGLDTKSHKTLLSDRSADERVEFLVKKLWKNHSVNEIAETLFVKKGFDPIMN
jgi:uncharacterized protein